VSGADAGVEAVAAGQGAGLAAHWAATDWGVKIESVSQNSGVCPAYRPSESYPKYKNDNETKIKKLITLDDIFNIRIIPKKLI
jgi:hypothetical protein